MRTGLVKRKLKPHLILNPLRRHTFNATVLSGYSRAIQYHISVQYTPKSNR